LYGFTSQYNKALTCELIKYIYQSKSKKHNRWLLFGDFIMVLKNSEKMGGNGTYHGTTTTNTLNQCDQSDLGFLGNIFTW